MSVGIILLLLGFIPLFIKIFWKESKMDFLFWAYIVLFAVFGIWNIRDNHIDGRRIDSLDHEIVVLRDSLTIKQKEVVELKDEISRRIGYDEKGNPMFYAPLPREVEKLMEITRKMSVNDILAKKALILNECDLVLEKYPTNLRALQTKGMVYFFDKNYGAAKTFLNQVVKDNPSNPFFTYSYVLLGIILDSENHHIEAKSLFKRAINISPDRVAHIQRITGYTF